MNLSVCFVTSRYQPRLDWLIESLEAQNNGDKIKVIVVSLHHVERLLCKTDILYTKPKPTVWSGPHRLTKTDWWSKSNSLNTALCFCQTDFVAFVDDRCVVGPEWLKGVRQASMERYAVCGPYEKTHNMVVENGLVKSYSETDGKDHRMKSIAWHMKPKGLKNPWPAHPDWTYGCSLALPLEWALAVNGFDEMCDGLSYEDTVFGTMLANRGYPILFDERMKVTQDRTPGHTDPAAMRKDKGVSPKDKSHSQIERTRKATQALHPIDLRQIRKDVLAGKDWPKPWGPSSDWFDAQPIAEM